MHTIYYSVLVYTCRTYPQYVCHLIWSCRGPGWCFLHGESHYLSQPPGNSLREKNGSRHQEWLVIQPLMRNNGNAYIFFSCTRVAKDQITAEKVCSHCGPDSQSLALSGSTWAVRTCACLITACLYLCACACMCGKAIICSSGANAKSVAIQKYLRLCNSQEVCANVCVCLLTFNFP